MKRKQESLQEQKEQFNVRKLQKVFHNATEMKENSNIYHKIVYFHKLLQWTAIIYVKNPTAWMKKRWNDFCDQESPVDVDEDCLSSLTTSLSLGSVLSTHCNKQYIREPAVDSWDRCATEVLEEKWCWTVVFEKCILEMTQNEFDKDVDRLPKISTKHKAVYEPEEGAKEKFKSMNAARSAYLFLPMPPVAIRQQISQDCMKLPRMTVGIAVNVAETERVIGTEKTKSLVPQENWDMKLHHTPSPIGTIWSTENRYNAKEFEVVVCFERKMTCFLFVELQEAEQQYWNWMVPSSNWHFYTARIFRESAAHLVEKMKFPAYFVSFQKLISLLPNEHPNRRLLPKNISCVACGTTLGPMCTLCMEAACECFTEDVVS